MEKEMILWALQDSICPLKSEEEPFTNRETLCGFANNLILDELCSKLKEKSKEV